MNRKLIVVAIIAAVLAPKVWSGETEDAANAHKLAQALQEHMITTYSCQKYLGGLGHYRAAKFLAVQTYEQATGNRNKAVLTMDRIEQEIKATKANEQMEAQFEEMNLSYIDSVGTCQQLTAESMDKVELLQAKLNLL